MAIPPDPIPTAPTEGPCQPWTMVAELRARCGLTPAEVPDAAIQDGIDLASHVLWTATGRRYGLCRRVLRPCWDGDHQHGYGTYTARTPASYPPVNITLTNGPIDIHPTWPVNNGCGCRIPSLILPGPIAAVESVIVNGTAHPLADFKIKTSGHQQRRALLRVDGEPWPCCNDLDTDPSTPGTNIACPAWQVTYWQGRAVPGPGQRACEVLAEQFARAACGGSCDQRLTPGLTRVSRRGVTREYAPADLVDPATGQTRTGLPGVDAWIAAVNPHRRVRQSVIVRPDDRERRRLWSWVDAA